MMKKHNSSAPANTPTVTKSDKILNRFLSKLQLVPSGCLEYTGAKLKAGYGIFHGNENSSVLAHRFAYQSYHEVTLKSDQYVRHLCNNPACSHPEHLAVGSAKDNSADMVAAKRSTKGRARAPQRRFTEAEKDQIKAYSVAGKTQYWIAKKYGRAESTISQVLHPKRKPRPTPAPKEAQLAKAA